jgi:hypothetical protein
MKNILFITSLLLANQIAYGMDNETMHPIKIWKDVTPFVGKVVMYHANSSYLLDPKYSYKLNPESELAAGFIRKNSFGKWFNEMGYELEQFITLHGTDQTTCLIESQLSKANLIMREANRQERSNILKAINKRQATFCYMSFDQKSDYEDEVFKALEK